jgi:hypothetical protein
MMRIALEISYFPSPVDGPSPTRERGDSESGGKIVANRYGSAREEWSWTVM